MPSLSVSCSLASVSIAVRVDRPSASTSTGASGRPGVELVTGAPHMTQKAAAALTSEPHFAQVATARLYWFKPGVAHEELSRARMIDAVSWVTRQPRRSPQTTSAPTGKAHPRPNVATDG